MIPIVTLALAIAAPVPKETPDGKIKRLFGTPIIGSAKYEFKLDDERLTVKLPGTTTGTKYGTEGPPRTERIVVGNFRAEVTVSFSAPKHPVVKKNGRDLEMLGGGIGVWAKTYHTLSAARLRTNWEWSDPDENGWYDSLFALAQGEEDGEPPKSTGSVQKNPPARQESSIRLCLIRDQGRLETEYYDEESKVWHRLRADQDFKFPDEVRIGVWAVNSSGKPYEVTFSDFVVKPIQNTKK